MQLMKRTSVFNWDDTLFRFGVYVSGGWVAGAVFFLWAFADWSNRVRPNEWGDIFAGVAAPVAFLWLVLGFLQQGRELKLQVEELRNTVKHQADMAEATREQVALQMRQDEHSRQQRQIAAQPRFVLSCDRASAGPQGVEYGIQLANGGAMATNIHLSIEPMPQTGGPYFFPAVGPRDQDRFVVRYPSTPPSGFTVVVKYTDALGVDGRTPFAGTIQGNDLRFVRSG